MQFFDNLLVATFLGATL